MLDYFVRSLICLLLLGGGVAIIHLWHTRFAVHLSLCVADFTTEVFDAQGRSLGKFLNKVVYKRAKKRLELVAIGQAVKELASTLPEETRGLEELDLVGDIERLEQDPDFRTMWGTFIYFCCARARQQMGKSRLRHLNVLVTAKTSNMRANRAIQQEIEAKDFRSFGTFRIVDSAAS